MAHQSGAQKATSELTAYAKVALALCVRLSGVGAAVTSMQPLTSKLQEKVQCHWRVLDLLSQRLKASEPVHNDRALDLILAIVADTRSMFLLIDNITPTQTSNSIMYRLLVKRRMKQMYKKTNIDTLLGRLDFLHDITQLLVVTLTIGEKIRWMRAFGKGGNNEKVMYETLRLQDAPAKTCLAEHVISASKTLDGGDETVTKLLPPFLTEHKQVVNENPEGEDGKRHAVQNMRAWWSVLLELWTCV